MAAQLLRLRVQSIVNLFRRGGWHAVGLVVVLAWGLGLAIIAVTALTGLRSASDAALVRDALIVSGSLVVVGFGVLPLTFSREDPMDPRRFALFGLPERRLAAEIALSSLAGIPALLLAIVLLGYAIGWSGAPGTALLGILSALLAFASCLLLARIAVATAALVLETRRAREWLGVAGLVLAIGLAILVVRLLTVDWARSGLNVLASLAGGLGWTPLGAVWAFPGDAATGDWGGAIAKLLIAVAVPVVLWLGWRRLVSRMLVTPGRAEERRVRAGLGWFGGVPADRLGVVAARSLSYWQRDARYWVSIAVIPVVPVLIVMPLALAGLPAEILALIPVPLMSLLLGWSVHNDTALDGTAIWLHVASGVSGAADRLGRLVPVLLIGVLVVGAGSAISVSVLGDAGVLPALLGVSTALLLGGLGIGSVVSARFPYPAVRPGDSPFQQPQTTGAVAVVAQLGTLLGALAVAAPSAWLAVLGFTTGETRWFSAALLVGVGAGFLVLVVGVLLGGRVFERRGPEILQAAIRA